MKTIKFLLPLLILFAAGCKQKESFKTNAEDYNTYLNFPKNENYDLAKEELKFWLSRSTVTLNLKRGHSLFEATGFNLIIVFLFHPGVGTKLHFTTPFP
jgi:hypothetical protein